MLLFCWLFWPPNVETLPILFSFRMHRPLSFSKLFRVQQCINNAQDHLFVEPASSAVFTRGLLCGGLGWWFFRVPNCALWKRLSQFQTVRFTMGFVFNGPCLCKGSLYSFSSVHFPLLKSILWCCFPCSTSLPHFTIDPLNLLCKLCLLFVQSISLSFSHFLLERAIQPYFSAGKNAH